MYERSGVIKMNASQLCWLYNIFILIRHGPSVIFSQQKYVDGHERKTTMSQMALKQKNKNSWWIKIWYQQNSHWLLRRSGYKIIFFAQQEGSMDKLALLWLMKLWKYHIANFLSLQTTSPSYYWLVIQWWWGKTKAYESSYICYWWRL